MVGHVDPAAGIGVLEPGPADFGVLLNDGDRESSLEESVGGDDARHPGTDHDGRQRATGGHRWHRPGRCAQIGEAEFVDEEVEVLLDDVSVGEEPVHDGDQVLSGQSINWTVVEQLVESALGQCSNLLRLVEAEASFGLGEHHI